MTKLYPTLSAAALILAAAALNGATPARQARITLVEHTAALGARAGADPSVARRSIPGGPTQEAHVFGTTIQVGTSVTEIIEVAFHATASVKTIQATNDFHVISGGTCQENKVYSAGETCTVDVAFKGMGPGHRAGQLKFATAESGQPEVLGLQGTTLGAAVAFTPALITTLPQSVINGKPLIYFPGDIAVDQGDNLYFTDQAVGSTSASGELYFIDGSQALTKLAGGGTTKLTSSTTAQSFVLGANADLQDPYGLTVDPFLNVFFAEVNNNTIDLENFGTVQTYAGSGAGAAPNCVTLTDCTALSVSLSGPTHIKSDSSGNLFFDDGDLFYILPYQTSISQSNDVQTLEAFTSAFGDGMITGYSFGLDAQDNVYTERYGNGDTCQVEGWTPYSNYQWAVAGSGVCGYAANNVRAQNAEIGGFQDGMGTDVAGDLYFADSDNNVLRRVDNYNGFIRTVAGNNSLGANYTGDGGPATSATLNYPVGVAVDSNGVIYTMSLIAGATFSQEQGAKRILPPRSTAEAVKSNACQANCGAPALAVIRKIGPQGQLNFPATLEGKSSPISTILLTNVGNDNLIVSSALLGGSNSSSFTTVPTSSSCTFGTATPLPPGESCQLGYQCSPKAAGALSATLTLVDNTATFANVINLSCYGLAAPVTPTVVVNPPAAAASYPYLNSVPITVTVSNSIPGPTAPTGFVSLTITNVATNAVYATAGPWALTHTGLTSTGTVSYTLPSSANLKVGSYSVVASYAGDSIDAAATSAAATFSVTPVTPTAAWPTNPSVIAGNPIAASQLDASFTYNGVIVPGTILYTVYPNTTTICTATETTAVTTCTPTPAVDLNSIGTVTLDAAFSPTDSLDYLGLGLSTNLNVAQIVPSINWAAPSAVYAGTSLGATQFDAKVTNNSVALPGTYAYSVIAGSTSTALCANLDVAPACTSPYVTTQAEENGTITLYVTFTPTNAITYASVSAEVQLSILQVITAVGVKTEPVPTIARRNTKN